MTDAEKLLEVAYAFVGTAEDPPGSNNVVFNTDYYGHEVSGAAYPWCMAFVWDTFRIAKLGKYFYSGCRTASCTTLMKWAVNNGFMVYKDYRMGDVFLYDYDGVKSDSEHTGIFTGKIEDGRYVAIEGNYADKVAVVKRKAPEIIGAFRPQFADELPVTPAVDVPLPELSRGDTGECVKAMQILLEGRGCSVGKWGCDGDFGADTAAALRQFQNAHGLVADAVCGIKSWSSLLGV